MPTILPSTPEQRLAQLRNLGRKLDLYRSELRKQGGYVPAPIIAGHRMVASVVRELADVIGGTPGNQLANDLRKALASDEGVRDELTRLHDASDTDYRHHAALLRDSALQQAEHARAALNDAAIAIRAERGDALAGAIDRILATLATYTDKHGTDKGGHHQRSMLVAAMLTARHDVPPQEAVELARHGLGDERVDASYQESRDLLERAERIRQDAENLSAATQVPAGETR
ncbi:hypothetical protein [Nonomuraea typhae]|uniref:hypothetical protein n=1 Tax=Nonomuraea typhae TaxID=2603600 RepID=UPI0012FA44E5|nr:hypothetical protein [Nonomuraea typhae]